MNGMFMDRIKFKDFHRTIKWFLSCAILGGGLATCGASLPYMLGSIGLIPAIPLLALASALGWEIAGCPMAGFSSADLVVVFICTSLNYGLYGAVAGFSRDWSRISKTRRRRMRGECI